MKVEDCANRGGDFGAAGDIREEGWPRANTVYNHLYHRTRILVFHKLLLFSEIPRKRSLNLEIEIASNFIEDLFWLSFDNEKLPKVWSYVELEVLETRMNACRIRDTASLHFHITQGFQKIY